MKLGEVWVEINADGDKLYKVMSDAEKKTKTSMENISRMAAKAGKAFTIMGGVVTAAFGMAVKTAAGFEQSMANVQSVAGATGKELEKLSGYAREMGKTSIFSASQAADAMYYLASAGMKTNEIMGALEGTLKLAAATQSDLAFTSESVAATLSQFQMEAEEADRVANVFAATIGSSQATMEKLSTSMSYVGAMAKSMGMEVEDVSAILGNLYNAGIDASTAGTALRMAFAKLLNPTTEVQNTLKELEVSITDSNGKMKDFSVIIDELGEAGLSAGDAIKIFGQRAGPAMQALIGQGIGAIDELTDSITDTDKASEMAATQLDTFQGNLKILQSAFEELQIAIGNVIMPTLTEWLKKGQDIINQATTWAAKNEELAESYVKWTAGVGGLMLALGPLMMMMPGLVVTIKGLNTVLLTAGTHLGALATQIGLTIPQFALLGAEIVWITGIYYKWIKAIKEGAKISVDLEMAQGRLESQQKKMADALGVSLKTLERWNDEGYGMTEMLFRAGVSAEEFTAKYKGVNEELEKGTKQMEKTADFTKEFVDSFEKGVPNALKEAQEVIEKYNTTLTDHEKQVIAINEKYDELAKETQELIEDEEELTAAINTLEEARNAELALLDQTITAQNELSQLREKAKGAIKSVSDAIFEMTHSKYDVAMRDLNREFDNHIQVLKNAGLEEDIYKEKVKEAEEWLRLKTEALKEQYAPQKELTEAVKETTEAQKENTEETKVAVEESKKLTDTASEGWDGITISINKARASLTNFTKEGVAAAIAQIKMNYMPTINKLVDAVNTSMGIARKMAQYQLQQATSTMNRMIQEAMDGLKYYEQALQTVGADSGGASVSGFYQHGTPYVPKTGLYQLHQGEAVIPANQNTYNNSFSPTVNLSVQGGNATDIAYEVERTLNNMSRNFRRTGNV